MEWKRSARLTRYAKFCIVFVSLLMGAGTFAFAAKDKDAGSPLPKDPAALLALAAQHNGLAGPALKPWHIEATYQVYDAKGTPTGTGTFEEWWASPHLYKVSFDRPGYHLQFLSTEKGAYYTGDAVLPMPEYLVHKVYLDPALARPLDKKLTLHEKVEKFGQASLNCVEEIPKGLRPNSQPVIDPLFPTYCLEPSTAMLRVYGSYGQSLVEITGVGTLDGHYIPQSAVIFYRGRKYLTIHLDEGESSAGWGAAFFTASPGMHLEPNYSNVPIKHPDVIDWNIIKGKAPGYPESAKKQQLQGPVMLAVLIGKDGSVRNAVVISAPASSLASSALAAVTTWQYQPFRFRGLPVRVQTKVRVVYSLASMEQFGDGR